MKAKTLSFLSILLFVPHGLEEYFTGLYKVDNQTKYILEVLHINNYAAAFLATQIIFWILLLIAYSLVYKNKLVLPLMLILELILVYELSHIVDAVKVGGYYPGLYTSLLFPFLAVYIFKFALRGAAQTR